MSVSNTRLLLAGGLLLVSIAAGVGFYRTVEHKKSPAGTDSAEGTHSAMTSEGASSTEQVRNTTTRSSSGPTAGGNQGNTETNDTHNKLENGMMDAETTFTRGVFFKPLDWGPQFNALSEKEKQTLAFKPTCKSHPRLSETSSHPADWAESFTKIDSLSRWPASTAHVIDWNQFWQLGDKGLQVSIRWNFELPPRYNVVGYSFALSNPDGYGTALWPDMAEMTWDDAKKFVADWEKKTLEQGGKAGTRTMSVAEKPFNPAEVSTEEVERAEYSNSRVRAVQSGKMICNAQAQEPTNLNCSCWF